MDATPTTTTTLAGTTYAVETTKLGYRLTGPRGATYEAVRNVHRTDWLGVVGNGRACRPPRGLERGLTDRNGVLEVA